MKVDELRKSVVMQEDVPVPELAVLLNVDAGKDLLFWHMNNVGVIGLHFDVDCDGFAGGEVCYKSLKTIYPTVHITTNEERIHGVTPETAKFCDEKRINLLIVVDSSSRLDYDMGCDVLVLDHHSFDGESVREINGHKQIVVSNQRVGEEPMSGCEVAYEFFRHVYAQMETPMDTSLAQWVGVSIISDVIDTKTLRNQFYVREAFEANTRINSDLRRICTDIDPTWFRGLYRSYVTYKLAPWINAISRVGLSKTLTYVISDNEPPKLPDWAISKRDEVCKEALVRAKRLGGAVFSNISGVEDAWRYVGLAATKLAAVTGCAALVFVRGGEDMVKGSFRKSTKERNFLADAKKIMTTADGHIPAFGFTGTLTQLKEYVVYLSSLPRETVGAVQLTSADISGGKDLQVVGVWNGRVNSEDELYITVTPFELVYTRSYGKVSCYKWRNTFDVRLLSEEFPTPARIYVENQRGIGFYLK